MCADKKFASGRPALAGGESSMGNGGQRLRQLRERLGLSLRDVEMASNAIAERHGDDAYSLSLSRLSEIESKGVLPNIYKVYSLSIIYRIAVTLRIRAADLFCGDAQRLCLLLVRPRRRQPRPAAAPAITCKNASICLSARRRHYWADSGNRYAAGGFRRLFRAQASFRRANTSALRWRGLPPPVSSGISSFASISQA